MIDPAAITFLQVPGPGVESWKGLEFLQDKKDINSGVTPQLSAKFGAKTLGQDLQAKEAALERMKTPLDYIFFHIIIEKISTSIEIILESLREKHPQFKKQLAFSINTQN